MISKLYNPPFRNIVYDTDLRYIRRKLIIKNEYVKKVYQKK